MIEIPPSVDCKFPDGAKLEIALSIPYVRFFSPHARLLSDRTESDMSVAKDGKLSHWEWLQSDLYREFTEGKEIGKEYAK